MQDKTGVYYYPIIQNKKIRMYVRQGDGEIEFRLWDQDDPALWNEHGWARWSAIQQAAEFYVAEGRKGKPPVNLYDLGIAKELLKGASTSTAHES